MRNLLLIILLSNLYISAYSQLIKGAIYDKNTNSPICFATIYFNGTFVGTSSDQNGNFELNTSHNKSMPLTISAIGYYSVTLNNYSKTDFLKVYLHPKIYELNDVTISAKSLERKRRRNLRILKNEFIGTTANANDCIILNEQDITFNYDSDKDTLRAYALKPLLIENKALGYKITYYLDIFEYYKGKETTFFCGNIIFNEDLTRDELKNNFYKSNREATYLGSRMHFFRTIWSGKLRSSGFNISDPTYKRLKIEDIVYQDENQNKFLKYKSEIWIEYHEMKSKVEFLQQSVYFDETGFFNPGLHWKGTMALQRVADWLPYEYSIEK